MTQSRSGNRVAVFGSFCFDLSSRELHKNGIRLRLEEKPALVMSRLIESAGAVVTRNELQNLLLPDRVHVDFNHGLNKSINRLRAVLGDYPDKPRYIETLSRRGYRFIATVEISRPRSRPDENIELVSLPSAIPDNLGAFAAANASAASTLFAGKAPWRSRSTRAAAIIALAGIMLVGGSFSFRRHNPSAYSPRKSVAILGFRDLSGRTEDTWLSTALTECLITDLAAGGQLRAVTTEQVSRVRADLGMKTLAELTPEMLRRIRQNLGSDLIISGYYATSNRENPHQIRVDVRVQDGNSGEILSSISTTGNESEFLELSSEIGQRLRADLGLSRLSAKTLRQIEDVLPRDTNAARLYSQGVEKLRRFEVSEARQLLTAAASIEPRQALVHSALSTAYSKLGHDHEALLEAQRALELSSGLPLESRLMIEGQLNEVNHDWTRAQQTYRTLSQHYPDDLEYGLHLAAVETAAGEGLAAVDTLKKLRAVAASADQDPRIDLAEAEAAASFSDFKRQRQAAHGAIEMSRSLGANLLMARAELAEGEAERALGNYPNALTLWSDARRRFDTSGDRSAVARTLMDEGRLRWQQGDPSIARKLYEEAITISRSIGDDANLGRALTGLGQFQLYYAGPGEGRKTLEGALSIFERIGSQQEEAYSLSLIADSIMPRYSEAKQLYAKSLELSRAVNDRSRTAGRLMDLGIIATVQGDLPLASQNLKQSLQIYQEIGERNRAALQLSNLAIVFRWEGKLPEAKKSAEEAVSILSSVGEGVTRAEALETLAAIELESGEFADAEATVYAAMEGYRQAQDNGGVARSLLMLADLRLAQHRYVESRVALRQSGLDLPSKDPKGEYLLTPVITNAQLYEAEGRHAKALEEAKRALNRCIAMGAGSMQMLARLTLAQIELHSGPGNFARLHLERLERDSRLKGFGLIVEKARKALQS